MIHINYLQSKTSELNVILEDYYSFQNEEVDIKLKDLSIVEEQLRFYSDMSLERNYLWKIHLEDKFPSEYVFKAIWNDCLPDGIFIFIIT